MPGSRSVSSLTVIALSTFVDVPLLRDLSRRETGERSGRDVVSDDGSRRRPRIVANLDRSNKCIVDRSPDVLSDLRPLLGLIGVVGEVGRDRPRADIGVFADVGVA